MRLRALVVAAGLGLAAMPAAAGQLVPVDFPARLPAADPGVVTAAELDTFVDALEALKAARARWDAEHAEERRRAMRAGDKARLIELMNGAGAAERAAIVGTPGIGWDRFWVIYEATRSPQYPDLSRRVMEKIRARKGAGAVQTGD